MSRIPMFSSPFLLGFDEIERLLETATKSAGDGYPPYNIERIKASGEGPERLRISLAVAGFTIDDIEITVEDSQLVIHGKQQDDGAREYLHRGIAARQFKRAFVLADGIAIAGATLHNGLLEIDLERHSPERVIRTIDISVR